MNDTEYTPLKPKKEDSKLQDNPYYWLYKVTREALDNENHDLHGMGHIWNRWVFEWFSDEEIHSLGLERSYYKNLSDDEKEKIKKYINNELKVPWDFPNRDINIDFSETVWQHEANFDGFVFPTKIKFNNSTFNQAVYFSLAEFKEDASFENVIFNQNVDFSDASFKQNADFSCSSFQGNADFSRVRFAGVALFTSSEDKKVIFKGEANFLQTKFNEYASFYEAEFSSANFQEAIFSNIAKFKTTVFEGNVDFYNANFFGKTYFTETKFKRNADFSLVTFTKDAAFFKAEFEQNISFSNAELLGDIIQFNECIFEKPTIDGISTKDKDGTIRFSFKNTIFATKVNFSESEFKHLPKMIGTDFRGGINLDKVKFPPNINPTDILGEFDKDKDDAEITWHILQAEMEKAGYHEKAVQYFSYELEAKRLNTNSGVFFKFILWLYKGLSNYGQSINRPFLCWFGLFCIFTFVYYYCIGFQCCFIFDNNFWLSVKLSLKGAFPYISDHTTFFDRMFNDNASPIPANNWLELGIFPFLNGLQTLCSLILIFLFGLGIRNRLRLK